MQAFIFDMDGVIVDSELHWKSVEGYFLRSLVPGWSEADQSRIIGLSLDSLFAMLSGEYGVTITKEDFLAGYHKYAEQIYREKVALIPGFRDVLKLLHEHRVPTALASSSPGNWIRIVLERFNLENAFKVVVSGQDTGVAGKPAPDIYLHTARELEVAHAGCVVIEDSRNGVVAAKSAGMYCIGFRNGFNEEQDISAANMVIRSYSELNWELLSGLV